MGGAWSPTAPATQYADRNSKLKTLIGSLNLSAQGKLYRPRRLGPGHGADIRADRQGRPGTGAHGRSSVAETIEQGGSACGVAHLLEFYNAAVIGKRQNCTI